MLIKYLIFPHQLYDKIDVHIKRNFSTFLDLQIYKIKIKKITTFAHTYKFKVRCLKKYWFSLL